MELAALVTSFLAPFLPQLLKLGQPLAEEAGKAVGKQIGAGSWERAKQLWQKLWPKAEARPAINGAAVVLADDVTDKDAQVMLTKQLGKLLTADPELTATLKELLADEIAAAGNGVSVTQTVMGDSNIVIGQTDGNISIDRG